jgi:hypothetical protein
MGADAAFLLAGAYEAGQEPHRAEEVYLAWPTTAVSCSSGRKALDNAARIRMQRGDAAAAQYERLVEITPETSPDRQIFEIWARLRAAEWPAPDRAGADPAGVAAPPGPTEPATARRAGDRRTQTAPT